MEGVAQIMRAEDFSDMQRLLRVNSLVLKFVMTMKASLKKEISSPCESAGRDIMVDAETIWIKEVQKSLSKNPKFEIWRKQFGIFTDSQGIMRCNGRLSKADLPSSIKHPILLDKGHHITSLIVQESHKRVMHGGVKLPLTELSGRFWNVQGRQFVKKLLYKCVICRKLVPSFTTSAFLRSLRRFSSRRGTPLLMVSDNGKTFKSAAREIKRLMNDPEVKQYFVKARMKWFFNLEKAPW